MFTKAFKVKFNRRYTIDTKIIENPVKSSLKAKAITQIKKTWVNTSENKKICIISYFAGVTCCFISDVYTDGKRELTFRRNHRNSYSENEDFKAMKCACTNNIYHNLFDAIIFPYIVLSNLMPVIILTLNPKK